MGSHEQGLSSRLFRFPGRYSRLLLVVMFAVGLQNKSMERGRSYTADLAFMIHCHVFVARKLVSEAVLRMLGLSSTPYWGYWDEVVCRTLKFAARIGVTTAPRRSVEVFGWMQRLTTKVFHHGHAEDIDLGLGRGKHDAVLMTLSKDQKLESTCPVILFFHGGGYVVGCADMYLNALLKLLRCIKKSHGRDCVLLSINYPLAPEVIFPKNLEFCTKAYSNLVDRHKICPSRIVISGDSAGGAIAIHVAQFAHKRSVNANKTVHSIAGLMLISPWVSHACTSNSHVDHHETDFISGADLIGEYSAQYVGGDIYHEKALKHPEISPLCAEECHKLPPTFISYGTREVFSCDIQSFIAKNVKQGMRITSFVGDDCPHIFPVLWPLFRAKSTKALEAMASFCVERFNDHSNTMI